VLRGTHSRDNNGGNWPPAAPMPIIHDRLQAAPDWPAIST